MSQNRAELTEKGKKRLEWAKEHSKVLGTIASEMKESQSLKGLKIGMALHVEAKTGILALTLREAGADVRLASCNPLSTDDSVAIALNDHHGLPTFAKKGESVEEYYQNLNSVLDLKPDLVVDDGCDLINILHTSRKELLPGIKGANEETTTGIVRLRSMERDGALKFPVIAVNDAKMKYLFDNRYGTGQSTFDGLLNATNLLIAGKNFVVAGYGWCGRGIAMRAQGLGARVFVTEVDPIRAVEARLDGFTVLPMETAVKGADFIVTVTGDKDIITKVHLKGMKDGCVLANSGHFNNEINIEDIKAITREEFQARDLVTGYRLQDGRTIYLVADGRLVNLAAGQGHPVEIMDMSFAIQAKSAEYLAQNHQNMEPKVYTVPPELDQAVARLRLESWGVSIDKLSEGQKKYLASWDEGT